MSSIFRKASGIWYIKTKDADGIWRQQSLKTRSEAAAREAVKLLEVRLSESTPSKPLTVCDLFDLYAAQLGSQRAAATIEQRRHLSALFERLSGVQAVRDITRETVKRFIARALADGYAVSTINDTLRAMSAMLNRSIREGAYAGANPFAQADRPKQHRRTARFLDVDQIESVLWAAALEGIDEYLFVSLCIWQGLRKKEAYSAEWTWIDLRHGLFHVKHGLAFSPKDRDERGMPLSGRMREALGVCGGPGTGYVMRPGNQPGRYRYRVDLKKTLARVFKAAGVAWCTPHTLRHTFASQHVMAGSDLYTVAKWLGHSNTAITEIYGHIDPKRMVMRWGGMG